MSHDLSFHGLNWLNSLAQWKGRGGFGLQKTKIIHERLGFPGDTFRSFHVAGTNGKGSVSCLIASVLGAKGFKVGLFSSPHLERLNERLVIDGDEVSDSVLDRACIEVSAACPDIEVSFFEAITLVAFVVFRDAAVDFAVIEVGLGGRLDSTNVLKQPLASAITTIDFDHENILGNTLAEIAGEKAGIIKSGTPLIVGRMKAEARDKILSLAGGVATLLIERDFFPRDDSVSIGSVSFSVESGLAGDYQLDNLSVAIAAVFVGLNLSASSTSELDAWHRAFKEGSRNVYWPNRLESIVWRDKKVLIDSAHNPAGIRSLISFLDGWAAEEGTRRPVEFVFGAIGTKRWEEMLLSLLPYASEFRLASPDFADPVALSEIHQFLAKKAVKSICYDNDADLGEALAAGSAKFIVCCGSMYLTGRLRRLFGIKMRPRWIRAK